MILALAVLAVILAGCSGPTSTPARTSTPAPGQTRTAAPTATVAPSPTPAPTPALSGGILVTFDVLGEKYAVSVTNRDTIAAIYAVQQGKSQAKIPNGMLLRGQISYNLPWHWHIDSQDIQMAEMTAEVSDGRSSDVEANLDYWVDTVKRFSPWHARIVQIQDFR